MSDSSSFPTLKRLLLGQPIPSHLAHHERLARVTGLAVLSSDALSSVAYATDFIAATLIVAGTEALAHAIPISVVITTLLAIVARRSRARGSCSCSSRSSSRSSRRRAGTTITSHRS